ncbi:HNH endonuclease [Streptomyces zinciresistens K42]|uniref:HNH endonuclease n=1 Tax=Streptomyces zinciresistens K42 TaxID=700597 RepID=G2G808_9ACTN|nr:HNH endonuclease [Streptomyces zinciresistens]EGX60296.1 HNH endonuclease [Streptomyces zinciresistens K42]
MSHKHKLNSGRRRVRKEQLARRHEQRCAYCRRPFANLREATLDHVAPYSLWRTWTVTALVLACESCNNAKADRFPLSLALVLLRSVDPSRPTVGLIDWRLLARLAHANKSAYEAVWSPDSIGPRSTPDLRDEPRHTPRHNAVRGARPTCRTIDRRPSIRPDCLRAPHPVRVCAGPTGEAVFA